MKCWEKGIAFTGPMTAPPLRTTQGLVPVLLRKRSAPHRRFQQDFFRIEALGSQQTNDIQHLSTYMFIITVHQNVDGSPKIGA